MNKVFTSMVLALGLIGSASAQTTSTMSQQEPTEIIGLSSYTDGNYNVEQLLVMETTPHNNEFAVHYKINTSTLIPTYSNNSAEIMGLQTFVESIHSDSLKTIKSFNIVGYSSPDGPATLNKRLAAERAKGFCSYLDKELNMSDYERTMTSQPFVWIDTKQAIENSSIPNKSEVISIIESNALQSEIEKNLKKHENSWEYIKTNILPEMRYVGIDIIYNSWEVVENRTLIEEVVEPEVAVVGVAVPATNNQGKRGRKKDQCEQPTDDYIYCVLVEMPGQELDFDCGDSPEREKLKIGKRSIKYKERDQETREKIKEIERRNRWRR